MLTAIGWLGILLLTTGLVLGLGALKQPGFFALLRGGLVGLVCLSAGLLCLALRSFEAFTSSTVVAEVRCQWVGPKTFNLTFVQLGNGVRQAPQTFRLRGDQWVISGGIVKWHPWLTALGLSSYHKLTRISGRFANLEEERRAPPTAFDLNGGADRIWWWFYRLDPFLPFVEATYGSAAFVPVEPTMLADVLVTSSGYLIQRKPH